MHPLIASITKQELEFIAALDYGQDREKHLSALEVVIFGQGGIPTDSQRWFPYEVIELGANWLQDGHAREFAICTLLVIEAIRCGFDGSRGLEDILANRGSDFDRLPRELSEAVRGELIDEDC